MIKEIWKPIIGFEDSYEISNFGRIKSLDRYLPSKGNSKRTCKGQILKLREDRYGYLKIILYKNQSRRYFTIHRLVAIHFIDNPYNKKEVNHINGNKLNNHIENLEWCSNQENITHACISGLRDNVQKRGEECNFSKLKTEDVLYIRKHYNKKILNQKKLSEKFNISISVVSMILSRKIWKHI